MAGTSPAMTRIEMARQRRRSLTAAPRSFHADAGGLDHLAPALDVLLQVGREVGAGALLHRKDLEAELLQLLADVGPRDHGLDRGVQLVDDRLRRALRQKEAVPYRG